MRLVVHNKRDKKVYHLPLSELREGKWTAEVPESDMVEVTWKNGFLTVADAKIRKVDTEKVSEVKKDGEE